MQIYQFYLSHQSRAFIYCHSGMCAIFARDVRHLRLVSARSSLDTEPIPEVAFYYLVVEIFPEVEDYYSPHGPAFPVDEFRQVSVECLGGFSRVGYKPCAGNGVEIDAYYFPYPNQQH